MDKLEEYIRKNREEMDLYSPEAGLWEKINRKLNRKTVALHKWLSIAAMILVILGSALLIIKKGYSDTSFRISGKSGSGAQENLQLKESEIYYNSILNTLYQEAAPILTANPDIQKELGADLSHLDSLCIEIKKDLKDNVANQEVVEALIQNYREKIRLLEDLMIILREDEINPDKKESYEL